jgi:hypothetical protein
MAHAIPITPLVRRACEVSALTALVAACGGGGGTGPVVDAPVLTSVTVTLSTPSVVVGATDTATAAGFDQRGAPMSIGAPAWTTAVSAFATVSASGIVRGVALGQTIVIAKIGGRQGQAVVLIVPIPVATVAVTPSAGSLAPGDTLRLTASTLDSAGNSLPRRIVTWSSTATSVAGVSSVGLVTARAPGTAIIVAVSETQSSAAVITVAGALAPGVNISVATPTPDQVVADTLLVFASATSTNKIVSVVASVGTLELPLDRVLIGASGVIEAWTGKMLLTGYYGTFELVLAATDAQNGLGIDSVEFVRLKKVLGGHFTPPGLKQLVPVIPPIRRP